MAFLGIGGAAGPGGFLSAFSAFNPVTFFGSLAVTVATSAFQHGADRLSENARGGFWGNMISTVVNPVSEAFSEGFMDLMQNWLGGSDQKKS